MAIKRKSKRASGRRARKASLGSAELLALELQEIQSAETQLSRALPRLAKAVESDALRRMVDRRRGESKRILKEVNKALGQLDTRPPSRKKNIAAEGLIDNASKHVQTLEAGPAKDAVVIGALQKTEHYCIAAWGTAKALGERLGQPAIERVMDRALKEGKKFDERLTRLAEREVMPTMLSQELEEYEAYAEQAA